MAENVLQVACDDDQPAGNNPDPAPAPGARALLDHLNSVLSVPAKGDVPPADNMSAVTERAMPQMPSFGMAVARQADQIQYLIEQIDRLDRDTQVAELRDVMRDLCGALNDVALRMKQDTSEAAAKIGLLTGAVTIISRAPNLDAPHDFAAILDGAKAAAERLTLLERLLKDTGAAILVLEDNTSRGQTTVRDLSESFAKLKEHAQSGRDEIAGLHQRIETAERSLAREFATMGETIEAGLARLHRQIETTDNSLAQGLAKVDETIEAGRKETALLHQRIETADQSLANGLAQVGLSIEAERNEIVQLQHRIAASDQAFAQGSATFSERTSVLRDDLGRVQERLESVETSSAMHAGFQEKIDGLSRRLEELEQTAAAEINGWRMQDSERFAALMSRLESLELKNQSLSQDKEQTAARLQAAEQALATMSQRQKALSTWHDRIAHVLLASPELPAV